MHAEPLVIALLLWWAFTYLTSCYFFFKRRKLPRYRKALLISLALAPAVFSLGYIEARVYLPHQYETLVRGFRLGLLLGWLMGGDGTFFLSYPYVYLIDTIKKNTRRKNEEWLYTVTSSPSENVTLVMLWIGVIALSGFIILVY